MKFFLKLGTTFAALSFLITSVGVANASSPNSTSIYQIFFDAAEIANQGKVPVVVLDIDDTLIQTAFRYLDVVEALHQKFEIFPSWSTSRSKSWNASHHLRTSDIVYADSFEKTLRLTLEKLVTAKLGLLEKMYEPNEKGVSAAMQVFFEVFFDPNRVQRDSMFSGSVYFLNNLLNLMRALGGKVVFLSGRADKYLDVTKKAFLYNGIVPQLLEGPQVVWYLKPSSGKISFDEDTKLDFKNDKAGMISGILAVDPKFEIAGVVDNEARNIFSLVNHPAVKPSRLYFYRSVDATWAEPRDAEVVTGLLDRIQNSETFFSQFQTYRVLPAQAHRIRQLFEGKLNIDYFNEALLKRKHGIQLSKIRKKLPVESCVRQLTHHNLEDQSIILQFAMDQWL